MATFKQILKEKRQSDQGVLSSIGAATVGTILQKMDPRNYLFKSGTMFNALFPKVKGYQAKSDISRKLSTSPSSMLASTEVSMLSEKLDIIGKNTVAIPSMARDMFLVKENIIKLVRLQGGTPRTKAKDWLSRQLARENVIEEKMEQRRTAPTRADGKTETKEKGFFASMLGFLTGFLGEGLVSMLIKGGLIVGILTLVGKGIREFFTNDEFRAKVIESVGKAFSSAWKFLTETDAGKSLLTGIAAVAGIFGALKGTIWLFKATVLKAIGIINAKLGLGAAAAAGVAGKAGKSGRSGKLGIAASVLGALGLGAYALRDVQGDQETPKAEDVTPDSGFGITEGAAATGAAALGYGAYRSLKTKPGPLRDPKTGRFIKAPTTKWTRFLNFLERRSPKLFAMVGKRLAALGAGFVVPGIGWIWSLIVILGNVALAWEVYNLWKEFSGKDTEKDTSPTQEMEDENLNVSPSPENQNEDLISFIKTKEGFTSKAKWDYQQFSIGYGTKAKNRGEVIDEAEADRRLREEVDKTKKYVRDFGKKHGYNWNKNQIDALTSFTYNAGVGNFLSLTKNGTRTNEEIASAMPLYVKAGSGKFKKTLPGLVTRRSEELAMFTSLPSPTQVAGMSKTPGSSISTETSALNEAIRSLSAPTVNVSSPTTTNVVQNQQGGTKSSTPAETLDVDLIKLLLSTQS